jgi:serine/threonine protein kinase
METAEIEEKQLITVELAEQGYEYENQIERRGSFSSHVIQKGGRYYQAKIFNKKMVFMNPVLKTVVNKEYKIAEQIKKNFSYLVAYHEFFYTKTFIMIVYEYCVYGSLKSMIRLGDLTHQEIFFIMKDVFSALEELKFLGIIHKNLTADHIYVDKANFKIGGYEYCDHDNFKVLLPQDNHHLVKNMRDIVTVPPEVIFNEVCTFKTPLYSLGAIAYSMFHMGNYHIVQESLEKLKIRLRNKDFKVMVSSDLDVLTGLRTILYGMLQVDSRDRLSFVEVRDFINRVVAPMKTQAEGLRGGLINKSRQIKEKLQNSSLSLNSRNMIANSIDLKKSYSLFGIGLPSNSSLKKIYKSKNLEQFLNQTIRFTESCKKTTIDDQFESQAFPIRNPLYQSIGSLKSAPPKPDSLMSTKRDFSINKIEKIRMTGFKTVYSKDSATRSRMGETYKSSNFNTTDRFFRMQPKLFDGAN